jgi:hypothetical protein
MTTKSTLSVYALTQMTGLSPEEALAKIKEFEHGLEVDSGPGWVSIGGIRSNRPIHNATHLHTKPDQLLEQTLRELNPRKVKIAGGKHTKEQAETKKQLEAATEVINFTRRYLERELKESQQEELKRLAQKEKEKVLKEKEAAEAEGLPCLGPSDAFYGPKQKKLWAARSQAAAKMFSAIIRVPPKEFTRIVQAANRRAFLDELPKETRQLLSYRNGRMQTQRLEYLYGIREMLHQATADKLVHLVPLIALFNRNPQQLSQLANPNAWRALCKNKKTKNALLVMLAEQVDTGHGGDDRVKRLKPDDKAREVLNMLGDLSSVPQEFLKAVMVSGTHALTPRDARMVIPKVHQLLLEKHGKLSYESAQKEMMEVNLATAKSQEQKERIKHSFKANLATFRARSKHQQRKRNILQVALAARGILYKVTDTMRMASLLELPFNPNWSLRKLEEKHDKMSKEIARRKYSSDPFGWLEKDVEKDIQKQCDEASVNCEFKPKLIRSPLDMANQGAQERHCVASYAQLVNEEPNNAIIFTVEGPAGETVSTLMVGRGEVLQHFHAYNKPVTDESLQEMAEKLAVLVNRIQTYLGTYQIKEATPPEAIEN